MNVDDFLNSLDSNGSAVFMHKGDRYIALRLDQLQEFANNEKKLRDRIDFYNAMDGVLPDMTTKQMVATVNKLLKEIKKNL